MRLNSFAQSICSHYSCFENMDRFMTLKTIGPKYEVHKAGCKKLFFAPYFFHSIFWTDLFKDLDTNKISGLPDKLELWVQIDWVIVVG
jgi:hypothetical protein